MAVERLLSLILFMQYIAMDALKDWICVFHTQLPICMNNFVSEILWLAADKILFNNLFQI